MSRKRMWQIVFAVYALIGVLALLAYLLSLPIGRQIEWHQRIRADLKKLARLKPTDANSGQWDYAVGWTSNLDANCFEVDRDWMNGFADELERRMEGRVGLADIEWIWDEYAKHTPIGQGYSDKYRPTKSPDFVHIPDGTISFGIGSRE